MSGIYVFLSLTLALIFTLTRTAVIKIKRTEVLTIEMHSTLLAVILTQKNYDNDKQQQSSGIEKLRLIRRILSHLLPRAEVIVNKVRLSNEKQYFNKSTFTRPYRYHIAISTLVAYLGVKAQKLTINDNAIALLSDEKTSIEFDIELRVMLCYPLFEFLRLLYGQMIRRKEQKNVGNQNG